VLSTFSGSEGGAGDDGAIERRRVNSVDAMAGSTAAPVCGIHLDGNRAAIAFVSDHFVQSHLAMVVMYIPDVWRLGVWTRGCVRVRVHGSHDVVRPPRPPRLAQQ
jgi:hypothetical protein